MPTVMWISSGGSPGYAGCQVVGLDLHRRRSVFVRMTQAGDRLGMARVNNDPYAFADQLALMGKHPEIVVEATYGWVLGSRPAPAARCDRPFSTPVGSPGFTYRRVKNERDAADLADLLRMGRLPESWIAPPAVRELREIVRHRANWWPCVPA